MSAETAAAAAMLADYNRELADGRTGGPEPSWAFWCGRLAFSLGSLIGAPAAPAAPEATHVRSDGTAVLQPVDMLITVAALIDAIAYRANHPGDADRALIARYSSLRYRLNDDRG